MNKAIFAGLAAGVLVVGLVFSPLFNASPLSMAQAASTGVTRHVTLIASEKVVMVSPNNALHPGGIMYNAMVFNGTIPGPVVAVNQGDTVEFTLKNEGKVIHSLDFHAGYGPSQALSGNVAPGESKTWTMQANFAGVFYYHCGADSLNGIWEHVANGMYGGIVVHPMMEKAAKEFYVVFGEIYNSADKGPFVGAGNATGSYDIGKQWSDNPDLMLTNGMSFKYVPSIGKSAELVLNPDLKAAMGNNDTSGIFKVKPGELTRWYLVNPGPNQYVAFHFIGGMIDVRDGSTSNNYRTVIKNDETWTIPPGSASVIEATFPEAGLYVGVDHNLSHVMKGAAFAVLATPGATATDHPAGTWVPSMSALKNGETMMMSGNSTASTGGSTAGNSTGGSTGGGY